MRKEILLGKVNRWGHLNHIHSRVWSQWHSQLSDAKVECERSFIDWFVTLYLVVSTVLYSVSMLSWLFLKICVWNLWYSRTGRAKNVKGMLFPIYRIFHLTTFSSVHDSKQLHFHMRWIQASPVMIAWKMAKLHSRFLSDQLNINASWMHLSLDFKNQYWFLYSHMKLS